MAFLAVHLHDLLTPLVELCTDLGWCGKGLDPEALVSWDWQTLFLTHLSIDDRFMIPFDTFEAVLWELKTAKWRVILNELFQIVIV